MTMMKMLRSERGRTVTALLAAGLMLFLAAVCLSSASAGEDGGVNVAGTAAPETQADAGEDAEGSQASAGKANGETDEDIKPIALAYAALVIMAIVPIYFGSWASIDCIRFEFEEAAEMKRKAETLSQSDVLQFPIYASAMLVGIYVLIKVIGPEYVNILVTTYIVLLGVMAVTSVIARVLRAIVPSWILGHPYHLTLTHEKPNNEEALFDFQFTNAHIIALPAAIALAIFYLVTKHWLANNVLGLSFAVAGIEFMPLGTFQLGALLLSGLFLYDIFWVFGTDVMVTVAKNLDAPVKVLFPRDFLENGIHGTQHAMLGLGDIVLPGAVLALLLRFDQHRRPGSSLYFNVTYAAYLLGLLLTIGVMHFFRAAQPALLYLVPMCLGTPILLSFIKGETKQLFSYSDETAFTPTPTTEGKQETEDKKKKKKKSN